jgi:trimeric autotransporter adhesin
MKTLIISQNSLLTILRWRFTLILVALTLGAFALASVPTAFGVVPAPDGGYPGGNTAEGDNALFSLTTGANNTAIGQAALFTNTTGSNNTANGTDALADNTTGSFNTANGFTALFHNTTGIENTANGLSALQENTTGSFNTANGVDALFGNTIGSVNTADGFLALFANTTGNFNTANGAAALQNNTAGSNNTAAGIQALSKNITGSNNTADGVNALFGNTTGSNNTASGEAALFRNTTGSSNIAVGVNAGSNLTIGNNNIDIGNGGVAAEANTVRIGTQGNQRRAFFAGISGTAVTGSSVVINASGQLGVAASSKRFKDEIKPMDKASEAVLALQPVTFRYKKNIDPDGVPQFGLVAEEVVKVNPDLVARDAKGEVYTVRYEAVNAMLLNEFLKEHRKNEEQENTIAELKSGLTALAATVKAQASQVQHVSAQLAPASPSRRGLRTSTFVARRIRASGPAPQLVKNP